MGAFALGLRLALCASLAATGAADAAADLDLILYGADGCVGHFAASHLAQQPGLKWAVAGRTESHLRALVEELAAEGGNSSRPEVIVAALDGSQDPKAWVSRAKVVISAAGPFSKHGGEVLLAACARAGVHYADTSDEFYWQRRMIDGYDAVAQQSGAKLVLSTGFCVMAGDLGTQLALGTLGPDVAGSNVSVDAWLETYNGGLSAGVINTGKAIANASYPKEWNTDPYVLAPSAEAALRLDSSVEGMTYPSYVSGEGLVVSNIFGPYDARLMRRTFSRLGQRVRLRVGAAASLYPKWTAFLAAHPGSWSSLAKCPSKAVFDGGSWSYRFKATSAAGSREVLLSGSGDPGYRFTAWGLAEAGLCLSGQTTGCLQASQGGVLTPVSALDAGVLRARLESIGLLKVETTASAESEPTAVLV